MSHEIKNQLELKKLISDNSLKKIFIISGNNTYFKTGAKEFLDIFILKKKTEVYLKKSNFPKLDEVKIIISKLRLFQPDLVIAVGGGCVMDLAKISSSMLNSNNLNDDIISSNLPPEKIKVLAIPTTAGSGAEVTSNAVIYIGNTKYSVEGKNILPNFFYLNPKFLMSSGNYLDATACFDAISQSVESIFSKKSNSESIEFAKKSLMITLKNFQNFIKTKTLSNAHKMLVGANLAGKAINISKTIAPHALSYPFSSLYGVSHGHAVSLTFNQILKFNYLNQKRCKDIHDIKSKYQILFDLTKTKNIDDLNNFFIQIKKELNLEQNLLKLNINIDQDESKILSSINEQRLKNNPIEINKQEIKGILKNIQLD